MKKTLTIGILMATAFPVFAHEGHHVHPEAAFDFSLLGFLGLKEVYNVHPAFVHFPIALIPSALLLYFLGTLLRNRSLAVAGRACLYLGLVSGVVAIATGLKAQSSFPHNEIIHHMMITHRTTGFLLGGILTLLTVWSFWHEDQRPRGAWAFIFVLACAAYLVLQNGDLGSRMVYIQGAAVKPVVSNIKAAEATKETKEPREHHHKH